MRTKQERLESLLLRTQLLGCEGERSGLNHWTGVTQGTACSRADTSGSGRQSCEPELNFTGRTPEHKKPAHQPSASVLFFFLSYRTTERAIRATV